MEYMSLTRPLLILSCDFDIERDVSVPLSVSYFQPFL